MQTQHLENCAYDHQLQVEWYEKIYFKKFQPRIQNASSHVLIEDHVNSIQRFARKILQWKKSSLKRAKIEWPQGGDSNFPSKI